MNNSTLSSNYVVYNNLILQWGNKSDYSEATRTITFTKPFSSVPAVVCGRVNTYTSSTGGRATSIYSIPTTASFQYYTYNQSQGGYFMWFAIGK